MPHAKNDERRELCAGDSRQPTVAAEPRIKNQQNAAHRDGREEKKHGIAPFQTRLAESTKKEKGQQIHHEVPGIQVRDVAGQ